MSNVRPHQMVFLRSIGICIAAAVLVGCTTAALSVGTPEEEIIAQGTTTKELQLRLGNPVRRMELDPPLRAWDIPKQFAGTTLLVKANFTYQPDGKYVQELPKDVAIEVQDYRFSGRLKRKHDAGESASLALMTLGLSEILLTPMAIAAKANEQLFLLTVWVGAEGEALAYRWTPVQSKNDPLQ